MLRRALGALLALAIPAGVLAAGFAVTMSRGYTVLHHDVPPTSHRPVAGRIPVAVLLGASGSVATDVLGPYAVLAASDRFDVFTVSPGTGPVALSGGLTAVPDYAIAAAPEPEIVIVPAVTDPGGAAEAPLRDLIERVHDRGGLIVGICAGARVLARTTVLEGRTATSFWSDLDGLRRSHPSTNWVGGQRWVRDGTVMTTAGVSSGIVGALRLVEEFAGAREADRIGAAIGYPGGDRAIPEQHIAAADYPYALNATLPWFQPTYGIGLADGQDEIAIAAAAELYGGAAFTARVVPVAAEPVVTTAHGLRLLATPRDRAGHLDRLIVPGADPARQPGDSAFDAVLRDIARTDGRATAIAAAKYIEYPVPDLPQNGTPWRIWLLLGGLILLTAGVVTAACGRRRRPSPGPDLPPGRSPRSGAADRRPPARRSSRPAA